VDTTQSSDAPAEGAANPGTTEEAPAPETPVEGEPAAPVAPAEDPAEKTPEEIAAEAEAKAAEDAKFLEQLPELVKKIPEAELRRLGQQYANRTMAAARRAERAVETVSRENATLKAKLEAASSVPSLRDDPAAAMKAAGFSSAREFIDHLVAKGAGTDRKPDPLDEVGKLRAEIERRDREAAERANAEKVEASKKAVGEALKAQGDKYARTATSLGQQRLWGEIVEYAKAHGSCPDNAVFYLADQVERELRAEFGDPAPRSAAKNAQTAPAPGAPGASRSAKATTITSKGTSGAPVVREYSLDPDEARAQVLRDLAAEGLLRAAAE